MRNLHSAVGRKPVTTFLLGALIAAAGWQAAPASAGVVVIANRTKLEVPFAATDSTGRKYRFRAKSGEVIPMTVDGALALVWVSKGRNREIRLEANSIYYFHRAYDEIELAEIGLLLPIPPDQMGKTGVTAAVANREDQDDQAAKDRAAIKVKLLVDDDQPDPREVWEPRLRERLQQASDILQKHSGLRLEVVAVDTWETPASIADFDEALLDFERRVKPHPAELAIGFTSQQKIPERREKLGGTRGPFHPYILVREWPHYVTKPEAVEVLVHELGHYLGGVHSPEPDSVLRPQLANRRIMTIDDIRFDPINTFIIALLAQERIRNKAVRHLRTVSRETKIPLLNAYGTLAQTLPDDTTARQYMAMLGEVVIQVPEGHPLESLQNQTSVRPTGQRQSGRR